VPQPEGGYAQLFHQTVTQAHEGADLDFLRGCRGAPVGKDSH
jgi:dihydroxy-acid dehydratase